MGKVGSHGLFSSWQIQLRFARLIKGCFELLRLNQNGKNDSFDRLWNLTKIIAGIRLLSVLFQNNVKSMTNIRQRRISCDKITHDLFFILDWLCFAQDFDSNSLHTHTWVRRFFRCAESVLRTKKKLWKYWFWIYFLILFSVVFLTPLIPSLWRLLIVDIKMVISLQIANWFDHPPTQRLSFESITAPLRSKERTNELHFVFDAHMHMHPFAYLVWSMCALTMLFVGHCKRVHFNVVYHKIANLYSFSPYL